MEKPDYYEVWAKPYLGALMSKHIDSLVGYSRTWEESIEEVLAETGWSLQCEDFISGTFTLDLQRKTAFEAIESLKALFSVDVFYDTYNKAVVSWNKRGSNNGILLIDSNNLRSCRCQSNTYDLVTRLIPIGKDEATINMVNDRCLWVEDFSYTDEIITGYWVVSGVENADDLLDLAREKIKDLSQPKTSYKVQLTQFNLPIACGDTVKVVDSIKGLNQEKRVMKVAIDPDNIDRSYAELGSLQVSFDQVYKELKEAQQIVNEDTLRNLSALNKLY